MALMKSPPAQNFVSFLALKRALLHAAGGAALVICNQSAAWAACNLPAANDVTALCDGTITSRYGSGTETNGTITVNLSASLSVTGAYAIKFGSLTNVYNYGTITATPSSANVDSFAVSAGAGSATVTNYAAGVIKGSATGTGAATGLYGSGSITINDNAGSITGTSTRGIGYGVYASSSDLTVTSNSGGITGLSTFKRISWNQARIRAYVIEIFTNQ